MSRVVRAIRGVLPDLAFVGAGFGTGMAAFSYLDKYPHDPPEWAEGVPPAQWMHYGLIGFRDSVNSAQRWYRGDTAPKLPPFDFKGEAAEVLRLHSEGKADEAAEALSKLSFFAMLASSGAGPLADVVLNGPDAMENTALCEATTALHESGHLKSMPYLGLLALLTLEDANACCLMRDGRVLSTVIRLLKDPPAQAPEGEDAAEVVAAEKGFTQVSCVRILAALNRCEENCTRTENPMPAKSGWLWRTAKTDVDTLDVVSALVESNALADVVSKFKRADETAGLIVLAAATAPDGRHIPALIKAGGMRALVTRLDELSTLSKAEDKGKAEGKAEDKGTADGAGGDGDAEEKEPVLPPLPPPHVAAVWFEALGAMLLHNSKENQHRIRALATMEGPLDSIFRILAEHSLAPQLQLSGLQVLAAVLPHANRKWLVEKGLINLLTQTLVNCGNEFSIRILAGSIANAVMMDPSVRSCIPSEQLAQLAEVTDMLANPEKYSDDDEPEPAADAEPAPAADDEPPPAQDSAATDLAPDSEFSAADSFQGSREGFVFKMGGQGLGYYRDRR
eukprot:TRINITY_DN22568_c0_g1_i1.p1 TRINITY_DN22568_c0_g1~~TRINITY_DN22568_c0_g1_i1.p1  ORF type:complete len:583 (+),score=184.80 TRINITY_DN22568_c0_g1_i1:58-1749(+)